mmetsp:Transcript_24962/g.85434  ORF Transcript_24962/g.85434 Transcript_24962/m.85434 type:complete len:212 (-) Transcript_24962:963-1598(-)
MLTPPNSSRGAPNASSCPLKPAPPEICKSESLSSPPFTQHAPDCRTSLRWVLVRTKAATFEPLPTVAIKPSTLSHACHPMRTNHRSPQQPRPRSKADTGWTRPAVHPSTLACSKVVVMGLALKTSLPVTGRIGTALLPPANPKTLCPTHATLPRTPRGAQCSEFKIPAHISPQALCPDRGGPRSSLTVQPAASTVRTAPEGRCWEVVHRLP